MITPFRGSVSQTTASTVQSIAFSVSPILKGAPEKQELLKSMLYTLADKFLDKASA